MTIVEDTRAVTGGVDTHADMHVAAALDPIGGLLGVEEFPVTPAGYARLLGWLGGFGTVALVGIEGTGSYGAGLARHVTAAGIRVVEVDRSDQDRRRQGKSDPLDAVSAARAAHPSRSPRPAHPAVLNRRDFVEAAPALPGDPRIRLPPASPRRRDGKEMDGLSPPSVNDSASWRTKALIRSRCQQAGGGPGDGRRIVLRPAGGGSRASGQAVPGKHGVSGLGAGDGRPRGRRSASGSG